MPKSDRGRFSAKRKRDAVLRLLRGEDLDLVSREAGVTGWTLEVRASATGAHELYRGFGFSPAGVRKAYYEQGEDAVVMWCHAIGDDGYDSLLDQLEGGVSA